ncbi:DNA-binding protein [Puniceibacterium antarcticum]|uniref:DNA-binding protein n=1 Tax=Puniceibacterium antarcticum TaxID=1206336 RepID=A0A2G8RF28_9RHOB|nr:DUF1804 family protein [Puniceibacterium antarcticum]PIL20093.1 DNA-binding protein [Puniceibacterium antarcticum]
MTRDEKRRKARSDYVYRRMNGTTIALAHGVHVATFARWKKKALQDGDNWDIARSASIIAGEGIETVVSSVVEDFMMMAQTLLEDIKGGEGTTELKVKHLVSLADAMTKMTSAAGKLAPKVSELGVAQHVLQELLRFVQENYPQHASAIIEIIEPFGDRLTELYAT